MAEMCGTNVSGRSYCVYEVMRQGGMVRVLEVCMKGVVWEVIQME